MRLICLYAPARRSLLLEAKHLGLWIFVPVAGWRKIKSPKILFEVDHRRLTVYYLYKSPTYGIYIVIQGE